MDTINHHLKTTSLWVVLQELDSPSGGEKKLKKESFFIVLLTNLVCPLPPEPK